MSFDIPEPFVWDESFKVFYEKLDEEHRGLFDAIFKLCKSPSCGNALNNLATAVQNHFANEEAEMKRAKYPDFEDHQRIHAEFMKTLKTVKTPVPNDQLHWAKEWLVNHIKGIDFKYKDKL